VKDLFPAPALSLQKKAEVAMDNDLRRQAIQAYYASTSFSEAASYRPAADMDTQVGHLLDALDRLNLTDKTIVVFHSDHGYHLGEKNLWQKMSIFEESARVPLIIAVPSNNANGQACRRPVELVSLQKTLTDLCNITPGSRTEGHSLRPLVENPKARRKHAAFSQVTRDANVGAPAGTDADKARGAGRFMGRSVRTERWRYTEWDAGRAGVELYDHDRDPQEMKNLAEDPRHTGRVRKMKALLRVGGE
jgi:arylsulfatase A-like enzyme